MHDIEPVSPKRKFTTALKDGKITLPCDPRTGEAYFPPRVRADSEGAQEWIEASGRGIVQSVTVIHPRPPRQPYNVALIDLEEGVRMMSRVEGVPAEEVTIGMTVVASILQTDGEPLIVFHPA